jgi:cytochrome c oxidase subunit 4
MADPRSENLKAGNGAADAADHRRSFVAVFCALCMLTAISVAIANLDIFADKQVKWTAFMGVAFLKAFLVAVFFMHLRWEKIWKYALTIPALMLATILALSLFPDIGMRSRLYSDDRIVHGPQVDPLTDDLESGAKNQ